MNVDGWAERFDRTFPVAGALDAEIETLESGLFAPLSRGEIQSAVRSHAPRPESWALPSLKPLSASHRRFLKWSNGGSFFGPNRSFDPILSTTEVREYLIAYGFLHWMPGAVPFAMDGGGNFFVFDMRNEPSGSEYPVYFVQAGDLGWDAARFVAHSFDEAV